MIHMNYQKHSYILSASFHIRSNTVNASLSSALTTTSFVSFTTQGAGIQITTVHIGCIENIAEHHNH